MGIVRGKGKIMPSMTFLYAFSVLDFVYFARARALQVSLKNHLI